MLLHHFGSRDELLVAVVNEVERRQRAILRDLDTADPHSFATMWAQLRRPELRALERLFFECYARGAQGEKPFTSMLPAAVDDWLAEADTDPPMHGWAWRSPAVCCSTSRAPTTRPASTLPRSGSSN